MGRMCILAETLNEKLDINVGKHFEDLGELVALASDVEFDVKRVYDVEGGTILFEGERGELGIRDQVVGVGVKSINIILFVVTLVQVEVEDVD